MNTKELTPQDKAINHSIPTLCYEIWEYDDVIRGRIIDHIPYWEAKKQYDYSFNLRGKSAHYILLTHDPAILRSEAISFAVALYEKKYRVIRIDTAGLGNDFRNK